MEQHLRKYIHNTKKNWNYITPLEFYQQYYLDKKKQDSYILIDLRKKKEFDKYHIKGATNIFWLDLLKKKWKKSPRW